MKDTQISPEKYKDILPLEQSEESSIRTQEASFPHEEAASEGSTSPVVYNQEPITKPQELSALQQGQQLLLEIREALGVDIALVVCEPRSKKPLFKKWQTAEASYAEIPDWLIAIGRPMRNIGVLLGKPSHDLCTLDFDDQAYADEFLELNPDFRKTYTTTGARGCNFWFRLKGAYPHSYHLKDETSKHIYEFRANKQMTIIRGQHPSGPFYKAINKASPIMIEWSGIIWPSRWPKPVDDPKRSGKEHIRDFYREIVEAQGEPFPQDKNGGVTINQVALVEVFLIEYPLGRSLTGCFFQYSRDLGLWTSICRASVKREMANYMASYAKRTGLGQILAKRTDRLLNELIGHIEGRARIVEEQSKGSSKVLHFANGMLDLDRPEMLLPFDPGHYSRNRIPHAFKSNAKCPMFLDFLANMLSPDDIVLVQKWSGMALLGKNFAQAILLFIGRAGAGKGTLTEIIVNIMGAANQEQLRTVHLERNRFELSRFVGKTLLIGSDVPGDFLTRPGASVLKSLTGGDFLHAERKGQNESISLKGDFNVIVTSNRRLRLNLDGDEDAWARRLKVVEFNRPAEMRIPDLAQRITEAEGSGIINWMIEGLILLKSDFKEKGRWDVTELQAKRVDDLIAESDSIRAFSHHELEKAEGVDVTNEELYQAYEYFCDNQGWKAHSKPMFSVEMPHVVEDQFNLKPRHDIHRFGRAKRGYKGIRVAVQISEVFKEPYVANLE